MPKSKRGKLVKKLDETVKAIVKARDGDNCQKCGKYITGSNKHASHVIPVSAGNKLRWEPQNMKVLCFHCHIHWWHKNPMESAKWFEETFPERWEYLQENRGIRKFHITELEELLEQHKQTLKEM